MVELQREFGTGSVVTSLHQVVESLTTYNQSYPVLPFVADAFEVRQSHAHIPSW